MANRKGKPSSGETAGKHPANQAGMKGQQPREPAKRDEYLINPRIGFQRWYGNYKPLWYNRQASKNNWRERLITKAKSLGASCFWLAVIAILPDDDQSMRAMDDLLSSENGPNFPRGNVRPVDAPGWLIGADLRISVLLMEQTDDPRRMRLASLFKHEFSPDSGRAVVMVELNDRKQYEPHWLPATRWDPDCEVHLSPEDVAILERLDLGPAPPVINVAEKPPAQEEQPFDPADLLNGVPAFSLLCLCSQLVGYPDICEKPEFDPLQLKPWWTGVEYFLFVVGAMLQSEDQEAMDRDWHDWYDHLHRPKAIAGPVPYDPFQGVVAFVGVVCPITQPSGPLVPTLTFHRLKEQGLPLRGGVGMIVEDGSPGPVDRALSNCRGRIAWQLRPSVLERGLELTDSSVLYVEDAPVDALNRHLLESGDYNLRAVEGLKTQGGDWIINRLDQADTRHGRFLVAQLSRASLSLLGVVTRPLKIFTHTVTELSWTCDHLHPNPPATSSIASDRDGLRREFLFRRREADPEIQGLMFDAMGEALSQQSQGKLHSDFDPKAVLQHQSAELERLRRRQRTRLAAGLAAPASYKLE